VRKALFILTVVSVLVLGSIETTATHFGYWHPVIRIETTNTSCKANMVLRWYERR
jgi:hypothetical protein